MAKAAKTARFLRKVWQEQARPRTEQSHAFIPFFDDEHIFTETQLIYPKAAEEITVPHGGVDIYFAPCLFRRKRRRAQYALPSQWLYADLDESDPRLLKALRPTVAWETSRGRYQALWKLTSSVGGDDFAELNQRVTYYTAADKGGWSPTKVLRVPGSVSTKHGDDWAVRLMWWDTDLDYDPDFVRRLCAKVKTPRTDVKGVEGLKLPKAPADRIVRRFNSKLPGRARKMLRADIARGDRSERLWMLYGDLLGAGMKPEQVLVVVRGTVWNKYAGQKREIQQLWTEINKAVAAQGGLRKKSRQRGLKQEASDQQPKKRRLSGADLTTGSKRGSGSRDKDTLSGSKDKTPGDGNRTARKKELDKALTSYGDFLDLKLKRPGWMVENIWSEGAHGVLAGEAKTYKSVISTDLAISVASGTDFLDNFKVPAVGPVIMIQEENDPGEFQDRVRRIAESRGLGQYVKFEGDELHLRPNTKLPIHVINNQQFDLTSGEDMTWLSEMCVKHKPALIILDPFYLMTPGIDENSAAQVGPVLRRLLKLKQHHGVGIQIIHHYRKQNIMHPTEGAARMSGTGVFHRWFESAVYVEKTTDPSTVKLVPEHRGHRDQGSMRCTFDLGEYDDLYYKVNVYQQRADRAGLHNRLRDLMKEKSEWTLTELRVAMGMSNSKQLKEMITDHDLVMQKVQTGERGRPKIMVRSKDPLKQRSSQRAFRK